MGRLVTVLYGPFHKTTPRIAQEATFSIEITCFLSTTREAACPVPACPLIRRAVLPIKRIPDYGPVYDAFPDCGPKNLERSSGPLQPDPCLLHDLMPLVRQRDQRASQHFPMLQQQSLPDLHASVAAGGGEELHHLWHHPRVVELGDPGGAEWPSRPES